MQHTRILATSPSAHILLELTKRHHDQFGDAGLFILHFTACLTRLALESNLPSHVIAQGLRQATVRNSQTESFVRKKNACS